MEAGNSRVENVLISSYYSRFKAIVIEGSPVMIQTSSIEQNFGNLLACVGRLWKLAQ